MKSQLALPFEPRDVFTREGFVEGPTNSEALAFLEKWPDWNVPAAAIYGPRGSGKSHLAAIWERRSGACRISAPELSLSHVRNGPLVVEDVDRASHVEEHALALFALMNDATPVAPVLLTGCESPDRWPSALPDLASRFSALPAFAIMSPDDTLLMAIARKLFADRQLVVPEAQIRRILQVIARSPAQIRRFVAEVDRKALAESRPLTSALIGEVLAAQTDGLS
jgi:chromosomal replication initiation ATPase DnaA